MLERLMDLVVLLAEMHQENVSFNDFNKRLAMLGYSPEEVDQALSWMSSKRMLQELGPGTRRMARSTRILSDWERIFLTEDSQRFLLRLLNMGILDHRQMERILQRLASLGMLRADVEDVKSIAFSVIFNTDGMGGDEELDADGEDFLT